MFFTAQINLPVGTPQTSLFHLVWNNLPFPVRSQLKLEAVDLRLQLDPPIPAGATIQVGSAASGMTGFELDAANNQYPREGPFSLGEITLANFGPVAAMVNVAFEQEG